MKTSIIGQAQTRARLIAETLEQIGRSSTEALAEVRRVEDLGIPLAEAINRGYVTRVTEEALELLSSTLDAILGVWGHGLPLWQAARAHETILSTPVDGQDQLVLVLKVDGFNAVVTKPETLLTAAKKVPLLWATMGTWIVRQQERGTDGPAPEPKPVQPSVNLATGEVDLGVKFPEGTPEYAAYAAELKTELDKFAKGEAPYEYDKATTPAVRLTVQHVHEGRTYHLVQFRGSVAHPVLAGSRIKGRSNGLDYVAHSVDGPAGLDGFPTLVVSQVHLGNVVGQSRSTAGPSHLEVSWVLDNDLINWA